MRILITAVLATLLLACADADERAVQSNVHLINKHFPVLTVYLNNIILAAQHNEEDMVFDYCVTMVNYYQENLQGRINTEDGILEAAMDRYSGGDTVILDEMESVIRVLTICLDHVR